MSNTDVDHGALPSPHDPEPTTLSARELQVLHHVSEGDTDQQTAEQIGISARTVRFHVDNLLKKMRARNRSHAVAMAVRARMLDTVAA